MPLVFTPTGPLVLMFDTLVNMPVVPVLVRINSGVTVFIAERSPMAPSAVCNVIEVVPLSELAPELRDPLSPDIRDTTAPLALPTSVIEPELVFKLSTPVDVRTEFVVMP